MSILATLAMTLGPKVIAEVAPDLLGGLMAGKGETAQKILRVATQVALQETGLAPTTPPDEVTAALKADPEVFARVQETIRSARQMELEHEAQLQSIAAQDRASARQMHVQTRGMAPAILAGVAGLFAFVGLGAAVWLNLHGQEPSTLVTTAITAALGFFASVIAFHFGSSAGSKAKTDVLSDEIRNLSGKST